MCMHTHQVRASKREQEVGPMQTAETYEAGIPASLLPSRNTCVDGQAIALLQEEVPSACLVAGSVEPLESLIAFAEPLCPCIGQAVSSGAPDYPSLYTHHTEDFLPLF